MEFDKEESGILRALEKNKLALESPSIAELKAIKARRKILFVKIAV